MQFRNKSLKAVVLSGVALLSLAGCNDVEGILNISAPFQIRNKFGNLHGVPAGQFDSKMELDEGDNKIKIEIKAGKDDHQLELKLAAGSSVPSGGGSFSLLGSDINEPFDLSGTVDRQVSESQRYTQRDSCSYSVPVQQCRIEIIIGPRGQRIPRRVCGIVYITRYGLQDITRHSVTTTVSVQAAYADSASKAEVAAFNGSRTDTQSITDYAGPCL